MHSKASILKKYAKLHPEAASLFEKHRSDTKAIRDEVTATVAAKIDDMSNHAGCKEKSEVKYVCTQCGHIYFVGGMDALKNIANATKGSVYSINKMRDFSKCPKCGSRQTKHETTKYWVDKKGNVVE